MNHNHLPTCTHEISYCEQCDVVTCSKCNKEWCNNPLNRLTTTANGAIQSENISINNQAL